MSKAAAASCAPGMSELIVHYHDAHCLIVEKPAGQLSVPGLAPGWSLASEVQARFPDARVVHRLDEATSGLVLFARGDPMAGAFGRLFEGRQVNKRYEAIVHGQVAAAEGVLDWPLIRDWPNRPRQKVCFETGKASQTRYTRIALLPERNATRLALIPLTGRTHQLRVHLLQFGHPILGDRLYGDAQVREATPRLLLHACELSFSHPVSGELITVTSPVPF